MKETLKKVLRTLGKVFLFCGIACIIYLDFNFTKGGPLIGIVLIFLIIISPLIPLVSGAYGIMLRIPMGDPREMIGVSKDVLTFYVKNAPFIALAIFLSPFGTAYTIDEQGFPHVMPYVVTHLMNDAEERGRQKEQDEIREIIEEIEKIHAHEELYKNDGMTAEILLGKYATLERKVGTSIYLKPMDSTEVLELQRRASSIYRPIGSPH